MSVTNKKKSPQTLKMSAELYALRECWYLFSLHTHTLTHMHTHTHSLLLSYSRTTGILAAE